MSVVSKEPRSIFNQPRAVELVFIERCFCFLLGVFEIVLEPEFVVELLDMFGRWGVVQTDVGHGMGTRNHGLDIAAGKHNFKF